RRRGLPSAMSTGGTSGMRCSGGSLQPSRCSCTGRCCATPLAPGPRCPPRTAASLSTQVSGLQWMPHTPTRGSSHTMSDRAKLKFFQVMAFVVGVALLVLTTHMVLRYGFGNHALDWWAMPHGFLYMAWLRSVAILGFAHLWELGPLVLFMLAGGVPFLSSWVEHRVLRTALAEIEAQETAAAGVPSY